MHVDRETCLAHSIHNLVSKDLLQSEELKNEFDGIFEQIQKIQSAVRYKYNEIVTDFEKENDEKFFEMIQCFSNMGIILFFSLQ